MTIQAIQTRYKGFHFRSRSEARWAVFCDHCSIHWQYELEGMNLGSAGLYLPDFWIAPANCYVEIKPANCGPEEINKWKELVRQSDHSLIVFNANFEQPYSRIYSPTMPTASLRCRDSGRYGVMSLIVARLHGDLCAIAAATDAAKSARFEHGESGAT